MKQFIFFLLLLISFNGSSQNPEAKRTNIWYFGNGAGLDFSSGSPVAISDGALHSYEGGGCICDVEGNLLFYTDGDTVWDRTHNSMPNGTGLLGCGEFGSSAQNGLIIPKPGSESVYYVFTNDCSENGGAAGLRYSIVDISLNSGFGDVTEKNILLLHPATEALTATKHANGIDYWVMGHEYNSNRFVAYQLNQTGIEPEPVISEIGYFIDDYVASIRFSNKGDKLALAFDVLGFNDQLFQFDNLNGALSGLMNITGYAQDIPTGSAYAVAFSPDDSKLYYMISGSYIYQYCLSGEYTEEAISATATMAAYHPDNSAFGQFQLGLDNKMYISSQYNDSISTMISPNLYGSACNVQVWNIYLGGKESLLGLPSFMNSFLYDPMLIPEDCDTINSINEALPKDGYLIFPNPAIDVIQIEFGKHEQGRLEFYNAIGQKVLESDFEGQIVNTDISGFRSGMYHLIIETSETKRSKKLVIVQNK